MVPAVCWFIVMFMPVTVAAGERPDSFADQAEKLSPAVVNISTTTVVRPTIKRHAAVPTGFAL